MGKAYTVQGVQAPKPKDCEHLFSHICSPDKRLFLSALAAAGNVSGAALISNLSRRNHYNWLKDDPEYAEAVETALEEAGDSLEREARRRAFAGSDLLLIFTLKGFKPEKYRDNIKIEHANLPDTVLDSRIADYARKSGILQPARGEGSQDRIGSNGNGSH